MPNNAFILGTPWIEYLFDDELDAIGHYIKGYYEHGDLAFPPVVLAVEKVPDSNRIAVTFANRYEVK